MAPPTTPGQMEGNRADLKPNIRVLATLVLATRKAGSDDEDSIENINIMNQRLSALEPTETRIKRIQAQQLELRSQIDRASEKIE